MMKKFVILLFVLAASLSVKAQVYVGGSLGLWHNDDADKTSFTLAPEVGYELNEAWSVGATLAFTHSKTKVEKIKTITNGFAFAPYARYSFFNSKIIRLFVDGGIGVSTYKVKDGGDATSGFELGFKPGIAIKLNKHFNFIAKYGFLGYRDDYMLGSQDGYGFSFSSEDLSIGFHYVF